MSRDFTPVGQDLATLTAPLTAAPLTMACWFNSDSAALQQMLMYLGNDASTNSFQLQARGATVGDPLIAFTNGASSGTATTSSGYTSGTWHHAAAVFAAANSRAVYIDGGSKGTNGTSVTPAGVDRFLIGDSPADTREVDGRVAEAAIWNIALSDTEVALLSKGVTPLMVRPDALVAYWPLIGRYSPEIDLMGGNGLTVTGAVVGVHPRIFYPPADPFPSKASTNAEAAITGTATEGIDEEDVVNGSKTIIITLTNDTWVASGATFDAIRQDIIDGLDSAQSELTGWNNEVRDNLAVGTVVRTSDTVVTITLSAQASYDITATETITVTVPATAVTGGNAIVGTPTFTVEAIIHSVARLQPQPHVLRRRRTPRRTLAALYSTVYSIPRDRSVLIDPLVIEFTVNDPRIRRPGGHVAGGDMVRAVMHGPRRVRTIG